ncbi:MAG TPA: DUF5667 domain-containing protein [Bacillota bacterium]|nr:DUF5667 domain-containing protein [Bacillota bacterium]
MINNKTISTALALSLLFGGIPAFADATTPTATTTTPTNATSNVVGQTTSSETVNPESVIYSLKEILHQIQLMLTFNDQKKADLLIAQANQKITELEALQANGNDTYTNDYSKKLDDILTKTDEVLKTASTKVDQEGQATKEVDQKELEKKQTAFIKVSKHSIVVLKMNLKKVPAEGQKGILNAIAKQEAVLKEQTPAADASNNYQSLEIINHPAQTASSESQATTQEPATQETTGTNTTTSVDQTTPAPTVVVSSSSSTGEETEEMKEKTDNGLHLGQLKHHKEKEKHGHKKDE